MKSTTFIMFVAYIYIGLLYNVSKCPSFVPHANIYDFDIFSLYNTVSAVWLASVHI